MSAHELLQLGQRPVAMSGNVIDHSFNQSDENASSPFLWDWRILLFLESIFWLTRTRVSGNCLPFRLNPGTARKVREQGRPNFVSSLPISDIPDSSRRALRQYLHQQQRLSDAPAKHRQRKSDDPFHD